MDLLQLEHMGRKLSMHDDPPLLDGILWPTSNTKGVILLEHQVTLHFVMNSVPLYFNHTCSRNALGILIFIFDTADMVILEYTL